MKKLSRKHLLNFAMALKVASVLMFLSSCSVGTEDRLKIDLPYSAIVGGQIVSAADLESKSTVLMLVYDPAARKARNCSGTLVRSNLIISAAHCYVESDGKKLPSSNRVFVFFGLSYDGGDAGNNIYEISWGNILTHLNYKPTVSGQGSANDIALLKLMDAIPSHYVPVQLFSTNISNSNLGLEVLLAGYGQASTNDELEKRSPYSLRRMTSTIVKNEYIDSQIAIKSYPAEYPYYGDSGGPAYVKVGDKLFLLGVCSSGNPDIAEYYESVQQQIDWLRSASKILQVTPSF